MHAFLTSVNPELVEGPDTLHIHPENSISIEDVRKIQVFLSRKPVQTKVNSVVIHTADKLTLPAQHALLKTLEEPPGNAQIYLVTSHPDLLLPTVLSRCATIERNDPPEAHQSEGGRILIEKLLSSEVEGRLAILDSQSFTREQALEFLDQFEYYIHDQVQSGTYHLPPTTYHLLVGSRKYLKSNCSVKLTLDHLALSLSS